MIKIGLTGGIGTGKSTVSNMFKEYGIDIVDADIIARDVLEKNPVIIDAIKDQFGIGFFDWRGEFRRKEFGNHIFRFPKERKKYEGIIMPYITKEIEKEIKDIEKKSKIVILDAPTLIENNMHKEMDYVILVCAKVSNQIKRIMDRDRLTRSEAVSRINAQMTVEEKKKYADIIIENDSNIEEVKNQVNDINEFLKLISN